MVGWVWPAQSGCAEVGLDLLRREVAADEAPAARLQRAGVDAFAVAWEVLWTRRRELSSPSPAWPSDWTSTDGADVAIATVSRRVETGRHRRSVV